jgi:hypothetical protein
MMANCAALAITARCSRCPRDGPFSWHSNLSAGSSMALPYVLSNLGYPSDLRCTRSPEDHNRLDVCVLRTLPLVPESQLFLPVLPGPRLSVGYGSSSNDAAGFRAPR